MKKNVDAFDKGEAATILALYPENEAFATLLREDAARFRKAVELTGAPLSSTEPVAALALRFEAEVDLKLAAAEVGLPVKEFLSRLEKNAFLARLFGALRVPGGTVQRELIVEEFHRLPPGLDAGRFVDRFRPQVAGADPESAPTAKRPFNVGTLTLTVPKVGDDEKKHAFRVQLFRDKDRGNWIHLGENGTIAVTDLHKDLDGDGTVTPLYSIDLQTRKIGEEDFTDATTKRSVSVKHDGLSDLLIYITDSGSFAVVKAKVPEARTRRFVHLNDYHFSMRKAGEQEIDFDKSLGTRFEVYRDENTGLIVHLTAEGTINVTSGDLKPGDAKYSPYDHGFVCKSRKGLEAVFDEDTPAYGIELWRDRTFGALFYASENGTFRVVPDKVAESATFAQTTLPPTWLTRFKLGVNKEGEESLPDDDRVGGVEIYRDENTGNLLYISETGHIAVFPKK